MEGTSKIEQKSLLNHRYTIGLMIPNLENPFYLDIAKKTQQQASQLGHLVFLCSTEEMMEKEVTERLFLKTIDGYIWIDGLKNQDLYKEFLAKQMPMVLLGKNTSSFVDSVYIDEFVGAFQLTKHLLALGHRTIALLVEKKERRKQSLLGYDKALQSERLKSNTNLILECAPTIQMGKRLTKQLLGLYHRPTAIIASNSLTAVGALQGAKEQGIRVPDDLSIVGFDSTILTINADPPLTSLNLPNVELVRQVLDLLIQRIEGSEKKRRSIAIFPKIIFRDSTKPVVLSNNDFGT